MLLHLLFCHCATCTGVTISQMPRGALWSVINYYLISLCEKCCGYTAGCQYRKIFHFQNGQRVGSHSAGKLFKTAMVSAPNFTSISSTAFRAKQAASGKETEASEKSVRRCIQFSVLQYKKDVKKWEGVQWSATEMMKHSPGQRGCAISILGDFQDTIV